MGDVLKNLQITTWYKAAIAISTAVLLLDLGTQRGPLSWIAGGVLLGSLGTWANHRKAVHFRPAHGFVAKITNSEHHATWYGVALIVLGVALFAYGLYRAYLSGAFAA